jgi:hypothetical protein
MGSLLVRFRRTALAAAALASSALGAVAIVACSPDTVNPGELIVGVDTNIALPGRADGFVLTISRSGVVIFGDSLTVGEPLPKVLLPATVGVVNGTDTADPVTVRMMATENGQVIGLREAVLTVPTTRVALLQLTVDGLCLGDASVTDDVASSAAVNGSAVPGNACDAGFTCILGSCQTSAVDAAGLPDFVATGAFGSGDGGTCFDSERCFHDPDTARYRGYEVPSLTDVGCSVPLPTGASAGRINIGVPADPSACDYDAAPCVIPLESDDGGEAPQTGFHVSGDQIVLPSGLCTQAPPVTELLVATAYLSAVAETPLCGSWSRVTTVAPDPDPVGVTVPDAGLPATDATVPEPGDAAADAGAADGDVWEPAVDGGAPVAFTVPGASPYLVAGPADAVIAWDSTHVQINHASVVGGVPTVLVAAADAGGAVGGVAADLGSVYISESAAMDGGVGAIVQCSLPSCASSATFGGGGSGAAAGLVEGHDRLYTTFGGVLYSCVLASSTCSAMASGFEDVDSTGLLAPAPEGVYFAGITPDAIPSGNFAPDVGTQRLFFSNPANGGAIGEMVSAGATDPSLFFTVVDGAGPVGLQRLDYVTGSATLVPVAQTLGKSAAHIAANTKGVVFADPGSGIYGCAIGEAPCTDAVSHPLVLTSGITRLAMSDTYLFWAVGMSVYGLPLPAPLRTSP